MAAAGEARREPGHAALAYPRDSAGRLMKTGIVQIRPEWTVAQAIAHLRGLGRDDSEIDHLYVTDDAGRLLGEVHIRQLLLAGPEDRIDRLASRGVPTLSPFDDQEDAVRLVQRYDASAVPVVDAEGHLLGAVMMADMFDVAEAEATEDIYKLSGRGYDPGDEPARSRAALGESLVSAIRLRLPWLMIALAGGLVAGGVMGVFEEALAAVVALAFFVPLVMDMGGNVGTQASTIFVRGMAIGQVTADNVKQHLVRETLLGVAIGLIAGAVAGVVALVWKGIPALALVLFLSVVLVCTLAAVVGYGVPWIARQLGYDPAAVSDPFITTIKDVTALLIYFGLARLLMSPLLS